MNTRLAQYILAAALFAAAPAPFFTTPAAASVITKQTDSYKAMLNVFVYDAEGKLLGSGNGFFISAEGTAVSQYALFRNASRAEVVDSKGQRYEVSRILGASDSYDLVKFSVTGMKKCDFFRVTTDSVAKGTQLCLAQYSANKKTPITTASITSLENYGSYKYYGISSANEKDNWARPLIDEHGNVVAISQRNVGKEAKTAYAIDARFINELVIKPYSALSRDLSDIKIAKALPATPKEAINYIYMLPTSDSAAVHTAYADFISAYPDLADGYIGRAAMFCADGNFAAADADVQTALSKAQAAGANDTLTTADGVHYQYSNMMYRTLAQDPESKAKAAGWSFEKACAEAEAAYAAKPYMLYIDQQGKCLFAQKKYAEAYAKFQQAADDKQYASSEIYYCAARSLELAGGDSTKVLALLDSAVACIPQPVNARNAQYYIERSQRLIRMSRFRDAVKDYNEYQKAVGANNLTDQFYFLRYQAEMEAHMYQQAIDDIHAAIAHSSTPLVFRLEEAYALLRVSEFQRAIEAAQKVLKELPENPDCYKIIGISYGELGKKALAQQNLQKAKELGDDTVDTFIKKYK